MAVTRVGITAASDFTPTAGTTYASPALAVTTGHTLIVAAWGNASTGQAVTGLTDTAGNSYTKIDHVFHATDLYRGELWYAKNITGHATNVVTATWSAALGYRAICQAAYSGLSATAPLEATAKGTGSGSATTSAISTTSTDGVHLLIPRIGYAGAPPAGFIDAAFVTGAPWVQLFEKVVTAPFSGTYTLTYGGNVFVLFAGFTAGAAAVATATPFVWGPV